MSLNIKDAFGNYWNCTTHTTCFYHELKVEQLWYVSLKSLCFLLRRTWRQSRSFLRHAELPPAAAGRQRRVLLAGLPLLQPASVVQLDHPGGSWEKDPAPPGGPDSGWRLPPETGPGACGGARRESQGSQAPAEVLAGGKVHFLHQHGVCGAADWRLAQPTLQGLLRPLPGVRTTGGLQPTGRIHREEQEVRSISWTLGFVWIWSSYEQWTEQVGYAAASVSSKFWSHLWLLWSTFGHDGRAALGAWGGLRHWGEETQKLQFESNHHLQQSRCFTHQTEHIFTWYKMTVCNMKGVAHSDKQCRDLLLVKNFYQLKPAVSSQLPDLSSLSVSCSFQLHTAVYQSFVKTSSCLLLLETENLALSQTHGFFLSAFSSSLLAIFLDIFILCLHSGGWKPTSSLGERQQHLHVHRRPHSASVHLSIGKRRRVWPSCPPCVSRSAAWRSEPQDQTLQELPNCSAKECGGRFKLWGGSCWCRG